MSLCSHQVFLFDIKMRDFTKEIDRSLDLMFKVEEEQKKKNLLIDKAKNVYLQVMLFKLPYTASRKRKLVRLRHSLYGDDAEICLFVPNRKTGVEYKKTTDELIEFCVDYYTEFLEKHKVKGITTIMPFKQLRSEYGTYELRRKLVRRFDLFLCKASLLYDPKFISSLGKIFKVANKMPFGVAFPKDDADFDPEFQKNIEKAIHTSGFYVSRFSDNYSIPIGTVAHTKKQLKENLETVLQQLFEGEMIPGGLQNVRALYLWPSQSKSIPLFMNLELPVGMKTPRDKIKKKKLKIVEGELSTQPHKKVFVTPTGEVFVSKLETKSKIKKGKVEIPEIDFEDDEPFQDDSDIDEEEDKKENTKAVMKSAGAIKEEEETESEDDEEIERRETRLLEEKRQAEEEEKESEEEEEEAEESENLNKKQKSKRKRKNESADEGTVVAKKKKSGKGEQKGKINKAQRKTLMKQQKGKVKEKINQKKKLKQKKV